MRVFHLSPNVYDPLPASHHTKRIWNELARDCSEYHVIGSAGRPTYSHTVDGNIHLHLLPSFSQRGWPFFFTSWISLLLALLYRPDRVVAQCPVKGGLAAVALGRVFRAPVLIEVHGSHYFFPENSHAGGRLAHAIYRAITRLSFASAARIRSLSSDMTDSILRVFGSSMKSKVVEIGNRVDLGVFGKVRTSYTLNEEITVVSVGSYVERKGHLTLIRELLPRFSNVRLLLVGQGPLRDRYREVASEVGVLDRLQLCFASAHIDVAKLLGEADIYVHSSLAEGVPRAILEAMAVGLPVVATNVGFLGGVVGHERDILLVPPNDASAVLDEVGRLIESEALRSRIGTAAAKTIQDRFEWNSVFDRYRELIYTMSARRN